LNIEKIEVDDESFLHVEVQTLVFSDGKRITRQRQGSREGQRCVCVCADYDSPSYLPEAMTRPILFNIGLSVLCPPAFIERFPVAEELFMGRVPQSALRMVALCACLIAASSFFSAFLWCSARGRRWLRRQIGLDEEKQS